MFVSLCVYSKGQCHEIYCFRFFSGILFPKPLKITLGSFQTLAKICGDIHKSRFTTGINDTYDKIAAGVVDTSRKFAVGVNFINNGKFATGTAGVDTGGN
jgi:hypothetical protein